VRVATEHIPGNMAFSRLNQNNLFEKKVEQCISLTVASATECRAVTGDFRGLSTLYITRQFPATSLNAFPMH